MCGFHWTSLTFEIIQLELSLNSWCFFHQDPSNELYRKSLEVTAKVMI